MHLHFSLTPQDNPRSPVPFRTKSPLSARCYRAPHRAAAGAAGRLLLSLVPALVPALVLAVASLATASQSRAEAFALARHTENNRKSAGWGKSGSVRLGLS